MLTQPTIEKLCAMRLRGMAEAFQQQQEDAHVHSLSFEERLGLLIDRQWKLATEPGAGAALAQRPTARAGLY